MKTVYLLLLFLCGCASFSTTQTDVSYEPDSTKPARQITTKVKVVTLFEGNSEIAKSKAIQTDKTQSASLGSLNQTVTSTNLFEAIGRGVVQGLKP